MRPGEVCIIRARDIDVSGPVWEFKPQTHKTKHHGRQRLIFIGPRGQEILRPYLATTKDDEYLFRPESAEKVRNELRRAARKSGSADNKILNFLYKPIPARERLRHSLPHKAGIATKVNQKNGNSFRISSSVGW